MEYNFDLPVNRRGTYSLKWDVPENELPMWVADMDFETAPEIREAIVGRASHGIFGYTAVPEEWYRAIGSWWQERYYFLYGERLGDFLHRRCARHIQYREEND